MKTRLRLGLGGVIMLIAMLAGNGILCGGLYFLSALWHECGHIFAARRIGIGIKEVRFELSGARLTTEARMLSYGQELCLALCGPLFNLLAALLICGSGILLGFPISEGWEKVSGFLLGEVTLWGALGFFALSSVAQAVTNLLPVGSFDGGRVLYCLLARCFGESVASRAVGVTSLLCVFLLWTVALYLMLRVSAGLGVYAFAACIFFSTADAADAGDAQGLCLCTPPKDV